MIYRICAVLLVLPLNALPADPGAQQPANRVLVRVLDSGERQAPDPEVEDCVAAAMAHANGPEPNWPRPLVVRLHLWNLEFLGLGTGDGGPSASQDRGSGRRGLRISRGDVGPSPRKPDDTSLYPIRAFDNAGKPAPNLPDDGGYFEFTTPQALLIDKPLTIEWIDAYRR